MDLLRDNNPHICWLISAWPKRSFQSDIELLVAGYVSDFVNYLCDYGTCFVSCSIKGEVEKSVKIQESHSKKGKVKVLALINLVLCSSPLFSRP